MVSSGPTPGLPTHFLTVSTLSFPLSFLPSRFRSAEATAATKAAAKAAVNRTALEAVGKRFIDWALSDLQTIVTNHKRELLEPDSQVPTLEFWKRVVGLCNGILCWRKTKFMGVEFKNERLKFQVMRRDRRHKSNSMHEAKLRVVGCTTLRSCASAVFTQRAMLDSAVARSEVSVVVDLLTAIQGDFLAFKGFKPPGGWGMWADGSLSSAKKRTTKIGVPRARKSTPAEQEEEAASILTTIWSERREAYAETTIRTFLNDEIHFLPVVTLLCTIAARPYTLENELSNVCDEFHVEDDTPPPDVTLKDVTLNKLSRLHDQIRCVGKAFSIINDDRTVTWTRACELTSAHFTTTVGEPPPPARTINLWGAQFVKQGCLFKVSYERGGGLKKYYC